MIDVRELGHLQLDALREVANIGAGHAATALSQLIGRRIAVDVPQIQVVRLEEVAGLTGREDETVAAVLMLRLKLNATWLVLGAAALGIGRVVIGR